MNYLNLIKRYKLINGSQVYICEMIGIIIVVLLQ